MKKIFLSSLVLACTVTLFSCKKDYVCKCDLNVNIPMLGSMSTSSETTFKATKKNAKASCESTEKSLKSEMNGMGTVSCSIQ